MRYQGWLVTAVLFAWFAPRPANAATVRIENPKNLSVDSGQVDLLYAMTCQEIAERYHVGDYKKLQVPLTVVLGEADERYTIDHRTGAGTIYLREWDELHFVAAAVMIAFHHVLSADKFRAAVTRIVTRFDSINPQTVTSLRRH